MIATEVTKLPDRYFAFVSKGLQINLILEGFIFPHPVKVKYFNLIYQRKNYYPFHIIRRTFGNNSYQFDHRDIRCIGQSRLMGEDDDIIDLFLKLPPNNPKRNIENANGPLLMIGQQTGKIIFYPPIGDGLFSFFNGLVSESQNKISNRKQWNIGKWTLSQEGVE